LSRKKLNWYGYQIDAGNAIGPVKNPQKKVLRGELVTRAAVAPATTTTTGWASQLAVASVADLLVSLGPASTGSELLRRAVQLEFNNSASRLGA